MKCQNANCTAQVKRGDGMCMGCILADDHGEDAILSLRAALEKALTERDECLDLLEDECFRSTGRIREILTKMGRADEKGNLLGDEALKRYKTWEKNR